MKRLLEHATEVARTPGYLVTPVIWAEMALAEAAQAPDTPRGAAKVAEARRYLALLAVIHRLESRCELAQAELALERLGCVDVPT